MDDTYLKSLFWIIVVLYTVAVIGVWENFVKPVFGLLYKYLYPVILPVFVNLFK